MMTGKKFFGELAVLSFLLVGSFSFLSARSWTVMVYLDADNNLEDAGIADFKEMAQVGSSNDVAIVVQMDRASGYDSTYGDWKTTKRFYVTRSMTPTASNALSDLGELNMGSPTTLTNFINWAKSNYPADKYALVLWNHGGGWRDKLTGVAPLSRAVCWDEGNSDDCLYMKEVRSAIASSGVTFDLIGFDACLMGHLEVAYELRSVLKSNGVVVASEETEPGDGWPYDTILSYLVGNPSASAESLGSKIVDCYKNYYSGKDSTVTMACTRTSKISDLVGKVNDLANKVIASGTKTQISSARSSVKAYSESDGYYGVDLWYLASKIKSSSSNSDIQAAAQAVMDAVSACVVNKCYGSARSSSSGYGSYGIDIYFPKSSTYYDSAYTSQILYGTDATNKWDDFLKAYYAGTLGSGSTSGSVDGSGTATISKTGVAPNTYYTSLTITISPTSVGGLGGGQARLTIPSGWTAPQTTSSSGQGYVKAWIYKYQTTSYPLTCSVSGNKVTVSGIPSDRLAYGSGDKLKIGYYKYTTGSSTPAKFTIETAGSNGTLKEIAKSPTITVSNSYAGAPVMDTETESEDGSIKPATIGQNYPNPFNPSTTFSYFVPTAGHVTIKLYNGIGQCVDTIVDADQQPGEYQITYNNGANLSRGVYYYQMTVDGTIVGTKKAVVLK